MEIAKPNLYVGCALTGAPEEFVDQVEALKERLADRWDVMHFLGTTAGTAADVYQVDIIQNVGGCDAFVGIMDVPSWGLGFETSQALHLGKPSLLVAHRNTNVTRLALGAVEHHPGQLHIARYENMLDDVPGIVSATFADVLTHSRDRLY